MNNARKGQNGDRRQSIPPGGKIDETIKLTKAEIDELKEHFKARDKGNSGSIHRTDVLDVLRGKYPYRLVKNIRFWAIHQRSYQKEIAY
jgi:Ca2+-binding EF-hand superfamily protein